MGRWESFRARWMPLHLDPSLERLSRVNVTTAVILVGITVMYTVLYVAMEAWALILPNLFAILGCLAALPALRRHGPVYSANLCAAGGWLCLTSALLVSGGFEAEGFYWLLVIPQIAGMLGGMRVGVSWTIITALTMGAMMAMSFAEISLPILVPPDQPPLMVIAQTFGILTVIATTMMVFLDNQSWAEDFAQKAIVDLKAEVVIRQEAEQAAQAADKAKSEFLAMMSHELRTPMNGVLGMAQMLLQTDQHPNQRMFTETIQGSGEVLLQLLNDILDFSKIEVGKLELEQRCFSLRSCLEALAELVASRAQDKGVELLIDLDPALPTHIVGDETRLRQMVLNLLSNAIKFTQEGEIVLSVREEGEQLRFAVRDTGIGISAEAQTRLFTAFTQADSSTTRRFGGTGLGLAIVRSLCELMGGEVGLISAPGEGSTFWFTIQRSLPEVPPAPPVPPEVLVGRRVLVVDDNPTNRLILLRELEGWGMTVVVASSAAEALLMMQSRAQQDTPFELAVLDMQMPDTDGLTLSRQIQADPKLRGTARLLLSSMGIRLPAEVAEAAGLKRQLFKPVRSEILQEALLELCGEHIAPAEHARPTHQQGTGCVLVVEDNTVNQMVARHFLSTLGYGCVIAENGQIALDLLAEQEFDAVLMDVHMPVLDGHETTRRARGAMGITTPIIGLTASAMAEDRQQCLESGMDDYLTKPLELEALSEALARCSDEAREAS